MMGMLRLSGVLLLVGSLALASAGCGRRRARSAAPPPPAPSSGAYVVAGAYEGAATDYVSQHMAVRYQQYASDMVPSSYLQHGSLYEGQTEEFSTVFEVGYCYRVIGVSGETMRDLDLFIVDENGNQIAQDTGVENFAVLGMGSDPICPRWTGPFYVTARAYSGYGDYGVQVFRR
jgi:hypothetical protein